MSATFLVYVVANVLVMAFACFGLLHWFRHRNSNLGDDRGKNLIARRSLTVVVLLMIALQIAMHFLRNQT